MEGAFGGDFLQTSMTPDCTLSAQPVEVRVVRHDEFLFKTL